jgi:hypothetical protein
MDLEPAILGDLDALAEQASSAVDSFSPGHWTLMQDLEHRAAAVIRNQDQEAFVTFLCDTAFLKQPYRINRDDVRRDLNRYPVELGRAWSTLQRIDELDYRSMDTLAALPWFGRNGGRAFNSAVLRLVCPRLFGIVDWRNLAVITGARGFEGLLEPTLSFLEFSPDELLERKGTLKFTQPVYERYNNALRRLAVRYQRRVADLDLAIWVYSIQKRPFRSLQNPQIRTRLRISTEDREALRVEHRTVANRIVQNYLDEIKGLGYLRRDLLIEELCSLFTLIRDECEAFGRWKRGKLREKVAQVVAALDRAIKSEDRYRLLSQWTRWANMVDPASPQWQGINLPADMVMTGYLIFEDFEPVKSYFDTLYNPESLEPRISLD